MTITFDLKNRPSDPFDFPHDCFEMSLRIQSAMDVLTGPDPWKSSKEIPSTRVLAYLRLRTLVEEARLNLAGGGSKYYRLMGELLGKDLEAWKKDPTRSDIWPDICWLSEQPIPPRNIMDLNGGIAGLRPQIADFSKDLENLGLYALRMIQAYTGKSLPESIEIKVAPAETRWEPIA